MPGHSLTSSAKQRIHAIAMIILICLGVIAAGALIGTILTAPIAIPLASAAIFCTGAASGGGLGFLIVAAMGLGTIVNRNSAHPLHTIRHLANPRAPKLGHFTSNAILPTEHARESYDWKIELMSKAEQTIELSGNFLGGELFRKALNVIDASLERSKKNNPKGSPKLQVYLTGSYGLIESEDYKMLQGMAKKWPENFHFLETTIKTEISPVVRSVENHVKLLVVDEKYFVVGGSGLQHEMSGSPGDVEPPKPVVPIPTWKKIGLAEAYRDMDFVGKGPLAKTLRLEFHKLWAVWAYKMGMKKQTDTYLPIDTAHPIAKSDKWKAQKTRVVKDVQTKALISDPEKPNAITDEHMQMIRSAKKTLQIGCLTFNGPQILHDEVINAAAKGVDVSLITNGDDKTTPWNNCLFARANYPHYLPLMMARKITAKDTKALLTKEFLTKTLPARIYKYAVPRVEYHKKITIIDDHTVIGGTYNYSLKSHGMEGQGCDYEMALTMKSQELNKRVSQILEKDRQLSRLVPIGEAYNDYHNIFGRIHGSTLSYLLA